MSPCSVFTCIPYCFACGVVRGIVGYGVGRAIGGACDVDVNVGRRDLERGIIPSKSNHISDLVVSCSGSDGRCEHLHSAGR